MRVYREQAGSFPTCLQALNNNTTFIWSQGTEVVYISNMVSNDGINYPLDYVDSDMSLHTRTRFFPESKF